MVHGGSKVVAMGKSKRQGYRKGAGQCAGQWLAARAQKGKKRWEAGASSLTQSRWENVRGTKGTLP